MYNLSMIPEGDILTVVVLIVVILVVSFECYYYPLK